MINTEKIIQILDEGTDPEYCNDVVRHKYTKKLISALGNDKDEVLEFLISVDDKTFCYLDEVYEELVEKFGEEVDDIFHNRNLSSNGTK